MLLNDVRRSLRPGTRNGYNTGNHLKTDERRGSVTSPGIIPRSRQLKKGSLWSLLFFRTRSEKSCGGGPDVLADTTSDRGRCRVRTSNYFGRKKSGRKTAGLLRPPPTYRVYRASSGPPAPKPGPTRDDDDASYGRDTAGGDGTRFMDVVFPRAATAAPA